MLITGLNVGGDVIIIIIKINWDFCSTIYVSCHWHNSLTAFHSMCFRFRHGLSWSAIWKTETTVSLHGTLTGCSVSFKNWDSKVIHDTFNTHKNREIDAVSIFYLCLQASNPLFHTVFVIAHADGTFLFGDCVYVYWKGQLKGHWHCIQVVLLKGFGLFPCVGWVAQ